ncbi:MAG: rhodanese-like domain-containing protein, partial [Natronospirillum sp.]
MKTKPVLDVSDLAHSAPFIYLDARSLDDYRAGHPESAVHVPTTWASLPKESTTGLEQVAHWESELRQLGITEEVLAVVYDDGRMIDAAR